jgi:hypothetical protein
LATFDRSYGTTSFQSASDSRVARKLEINWSAVFGGTLLGWGLLFLLSVIGAAIGFASIDPYAVHPGAGLDTGSGVWALAAMIATSFLGAFFVVRISGDRRRSESLLHGGISWGLSMLLGAGIALFAAGAAANASASAATPSSRAKTYVTSSGSVAPNLTRAERVRADEAKSDAARGAGLAGGGAALALIFSLFGALFAASRSSGISIAEEFRLHGPKKASKAQKSTVIIPDRRDETTILPPTH